MEASAGVARPSLVSSVKQIVQNEGGLHGLFRGNVAATYLWVGYAIVQFALYARTYEYLTTAGYVSAPPNESRSSTRTIPSVTSMPTCWRAWRQEIASKPTTVAFISGATAGVCATLATYPFDICRTAFAAEGLITAASTTKAATQPATMAQFYKRMVSQHGYRGFFAGVCPALIQIIPYMGINFALYDTFTRISNSHSVLNAGAAGTISGGLSKIIVYPLGETNFFDMLKAKFLLFIGIISLTLNISDGTKIIIDTVKKRLQAQTFASLLKPTPGTAASNLPYQNQYKGMVDCIIQTARDESIVGFYRGMVPSVMKNAAATGITFAIFTLSKNALEAAHDARCRDVITRQHQNVKLRKSD
jgi:solute carrier family 25 thiamine pyrophosphate transporter 19